MARLQTLVFLSRTRGFSTGLTISAGILGGLFLVCAVVPLRLMLGTNHEVDTGLVLTGAFCCWLLARSPGTDHFVARWRSWILAAAGIWTLFLPGILSLAGKMLNRIPLEVLAWPLVAYATVCAIACLTAGPVLMSILLSHAESCRWGAAARWQWLFGLAASCLLLPTLVLPFTGSLVLGWAGLVMAGLWGVASATVDRSASLEPTSRSVAAPTAGRWQISIMALATGVSLALTAFIAGQLIPRNLTADMTLLAGLILGAGLALLRRSWSVTAAVGVSSSVACLSLAAWTGMITAGYPLWTRFCLHINAWVGNVALLFALRMALLLLLIVPAGFLIRRLISRRDGLAVSPAVPFLLAAGFVAAPWIPCTPRMAALSLTLLGLGLSLMCWAREQFRMPAGLWPRVGTGGLVSLAVCGVVFSQNLDPRQSERTIFSSAAVQAYRAGVPVARARWLDESRTVASFSTLLGHDSVTTLRGSLAAWRQNGLMLSQHSADPAICPHNAGDLLPVLLPLTLHPDPEQVLILGIHPPTLLACHQFPLRSVQTVDGSSSSYQMLAWLRSQPEGGLDLKQGPDFHFLKIAPELALQGEHASSYDLITAPHALPNTAGAVSQYTREYYTQVCHRLRERGIFSQRVPYFDLGPQVVAELTSTLQSVFGDVLAVESVPGELIFLCARERLPEIDEDYTERLKAPQVRRLLGEAGWDWSLILGRGGLDHQGLKAFCGKRTHVNSCGNTWLTSWLPIEVSRWGLKGDATRQELSKRGVALRSRLDETSIGKEVSDRLEDLNLAHQIQRDHPNDPWAYRAALKSRLQDRPRATIMQVNHQLKRVMDPEDQRRKDYLLALGPTARNPNPGWADVQQLTGFESPFDPLVSLFVYFETANMLARCEPAQPALLLQHLQHTVYFSSGYDQSVRNVAEAVALLCQDEHLQPEPARRWDKVNSLMQMLAVRWQLRLASERSSKYEASDIQKCLTAAESALQLLAHDFPAAGLSQREWELRKETLELALMRPLRQHRSEQARVVPLIPVSPGKTEAAASATSSAAAPAPARNIQ